MQFPPSSKRGILFFPLLVAGVIASVVACGGGSNSPTPTATSNLAAAANGTTTNALYDRALVFSTGVPELGTTGSTTITFSSNSANTLTPLFSIKTTDGGEAKGTTTFGSCIFTVTSSTTGFIAAGKAIKIDPCTMNATMTGAVINQTTNSNVTLLLGSKSSVAVPIPLTVSATGVVTFNNTVLGNVTLSVSTTGAN